MSVSQDILFDYKCVCSNTIYPLKLQVIPIHKVFNALGEDRAKGLLMFHSLTGCDTTAGMLGITKHTAFQKWLDIAAKDSSILVAMNSLTTQDLTVINLDDRWAIINHVLRKISSFKNLLSIIRYNC